MNLREIEWQLGVLRSASHVFSPTMKEALVAAEYIVANARQVIDGAEQDANQLVRRLHQMDHDSELCAAARRYITQLGAVEGLTNDQAHEALITIISWLEN